MTEKLHRTASRMDAPGAGIIRSIEGDIPVSSIVHGAYFLHEGVAWKAFESSRHVGGTAGEVVFAKRVCWFEEELRHFGAKLAIRVDETKSIAVDFLTSEARRMGAGGIYGLLEEE